MAARMPVYHSRLRIKEDDVGADLQWEAHRSGTDRRANMRPCRTDGIWTHRMNCRSSP